jgi:two-component system sensor kinase
MDGTEEAPQETLLCAPSEAGTAWEKVFGGRYRAERLLKKGPDGATFLGTDCAQGDAVVIKTASARLLSTGAQMRLEHEAGILGQIRSPCFAALRALGREEGFVYLVMPFIPGVTLQTRLAQGPLAVRESLLVGYCLLTALQEVHDQGVLHRDVKPANLIVNDGVALERATLIDFGLARSARLDVSIRDQPAGTARYLAPEQAGLLDHDVEESADLYSAGVVLFECLAGSPPFEGATVGEVLRQHMASPPPLLRNIGLAVPRALDEVIQRLLRKGPRDRYQSAGAVLADLRAITEAWDRGILEPSLVVGTADRRRTLAEPAFVGRGGEVAALEAEVAAARSGQGGLVLLEADSGGGKTRLLDELAQLGRRQGAWVLRGQGEDQAAQRPFQPLVGVARELVAAARADPGQAAMIQERLGEQREAVCAALPELAEILGANTPQLLGPESFGEARCLQALGALLDALGSVARPALVLLDDCQWADELTLKLLGHWQRRRRSPSNRHVLLVGALRSEEVPGDHRLRALHPAAHLRLPPFQAADVRRLAESMAGPLPQAAVEVVERLAEGSPFMASAVLRGLVESGALVPEPTGWRVEPLALADLRSSRQAAAVLSRRMELLPPEALRVLSTGAVLGKEFEIDLAAGLAGQTVGSAFAALDEARRRHIVWARGHGARGVFVHDKLRETLLQRLAPAERQSLHLRAALHLERQDTQNVFDLAYHFDAAGDSARALPYALAAAKRARSQHSLEVAEQQYRIAGRGAVDSDRGARYRIAEELGDVLMLRGRYDDAAQQFQAARDLADGDLARAEIDGKLGELAFKRGDMETASAAIERALRALGRRMPRHFATFTLLVLWEALVQLLHTWLPRLFLARRKLEGTERERLVIRLYNRLTYAYWFQYGKIPCFWAHLRAMNRAERYPPTLELAQTYSIHAPMMSLIPRIDRGIAYAERSLAIRKSLGDLWGQGQSLHFHGVVLHCASRFAESIDKCREAVRLLERTGDFWEVNIAHYHIAMNLYRLGELREAVAEAQRVHQSGLELGDAQASGLSLDVWAWASGGRVPGQTIQVELARSQEDAHRGAQVMVAEGVRLIREGRPGDAARVLEQADQLARKAGIKNTYVLPALTWLATALRQQVETTPAGAPGVRQALLRRAKAAARRGLRLARSFQNELPHALREWGLLEAMSGRPRRAQRSLAQSLAVADWQGARFERAQTLLARGRLGMALGWAGAAEDLETARVALGVLGADYLLDEPAAAGSAAEVGSLALMDRFDTVLEAGRRIATALSRDCILAAVRDAALRLLRGELCQVFQVTSSDKEAQGVPIVFGEPGTEYSSALTRVALASGRPVTFVEGTPGEVSESVELSGIRSALCAPIFVRGRAVACLHVSHRQVGGLFGPDEERLAEFIATLAGAALENAEGFNALERLNETLELCVAERTAAAEARARELARSNAELEQFAYVASHDLQEPLRMVSSYMELLVQRYKNQFDGKARQWIGFAQDGASWMKQLINDVLRFSRVGTRGKPFQPTDCGAVFKTVLGNLATAIQDSNAVVTCGPLPTLLADATQLTQLMQNLIGNAIKYRSARPPEVRVEARRQAEGWLFTVRDNGIGIDPQFFERIMVIFQRLHTREEYPGTGIGLALCKKIVERHGGRLWVDSQLGQGATFFFTIPQAVVLSSQGVTSVVSTHHERPADPRPADGGQPQ